MCLADDASRRVVSCLVQQRLSATRPLASGLSSMLPLGPDSGSNAIHETGKEGKEWKTGNAKPANWSVSGFLFPVFHFPFALAKTFPIRDY
jgi:hypothetical protein